MKLRIYGGNSGYNGYSMSWRAVWAREEGRFPKTDFKKNYKVTEKSFVMLVNLGIITGGEWHHTGCYGRRTTFYDWRDEEDYDFYFKNKKIIDGFARKKNYTDVEELFDY